MSFILEAIMLHRAETGTIDVIERGELNRLIYPAFDTRAFTAITNPAFSDEGRLPRVRFCDLPERVRKMIHGRYWEEAVVHGYKTSDIRDFGLDRVMEVNDAYMHNGHELQYYAQTSIEKYLHPALVRILKDNLHNTDYIAVVSL